jgi:hypothetical protein
VYFIQSTVFLKQNMLLFIGSIMLSITQDNASQLLRSIKENQDIELLDLLEINIKKL